MVLILAIAKFFLDDSPDNIHELEQVLESAQKEKKEMFLYAFKVCSFLKILIFLLSVL